MVSLLALGLGLGACGSDDDDAAGDGGVTVSGAWARASAEGQANGAVYMQLRADQDDRLVSASVADSVAATAEIHEVVMVEPSADEMSGSMPEATSDGMEGMDATMRMQELEDGLVLPAGETVTLEPGGYHVMLLDLAGPLEVGDEIDVTLQFAETGTVTITVPVAETAP